MTLRDANDHDGATARLQIARRHARLLAIVGDGDVRHFRQACDSGRSTLNVCSQALSYRCHRCPAFCGELVRFHGGIAMDAAHATFSHLMRAGLAAGPLRPDRAGAAGRRRARRLPGRRLPGAARSRHRAGLGVRRVDRRDQCGDHRRQSARAPAGAAARPSGSASPRARSGTTRRTATSSARRATPTSSFADDDAGPARLLQAARRQTRGSSPAGAHDRDQLLRHRAVARDAARTGRLLDLINDAQGPFLGRRGQRADRQFRLLRQQRTR